MLDEKIGSLPVLDADEKLVGLLTESDIYRMIVRQWRDENLIHARRRNDHLSHERHVKRH
jgi:CBS domain-containing protein